MLAAEASARLAPLTPNELPPASVAVTGPGVPGAPGSFSVLVIASGLGALTVPTPAETSAVPMATDGPKVVRPELWVKVPIVVLAGLKCPVDRRCRNAAAARADRAPGDGQTNHATVLLKFTEPAVTVAAPPLPLIRPS